MNLYLLDSDIFTHYRNRLPQVVKRVATYRRAVFLPVIVVDEAISGWKAAIQKAKTPDQIEDGFRHLIRTMYALGGFPIANFAKIAIARYELLKKLKLNIGGNDLRIAAIALEANATVVTANIRDFSRVPGLQFEDWSQS